MSGAAHKPGAVALRPLGLGDVYDAAFTLIRHNPQATVGAALLVSAIGTAIPVAVVALLSAAYDLPNPFQVQAPAPGQEESQALASMTSNLALVGAGLLAGIGQLFVTGMIAHVALAGALGRTLTLEGAWEATRGRRWHLVGLTLVLIVATTAVLAAYVVLSVVVVLTEMTVAIVLWFLLSIPLLVALLVWAWIRLAYLPVPVLMLERTGVLAAIQRAFALTRGQFWRTLGIALLTGLITSFAAQVLSTPFALIAVALGFAMGDSQWALLVVLALQSVGTVLASAFTTPFTAAVTSVQYLDQRFRKEAFDLELMQRAGLTVPLGRR